MAERLPFSGERDAYAMLANSNSCQATMLLEKIDQEVGKPSSVIPANAGIQALRVYYRSN